MFTNYSFIEEFKALSDDLAEKFRRKIADQPHRYQHWQIRHQDERDRAAEEIRRERRINPEWGKQRYWELDSNAVKSIKHNMKKHKERIVQ